MLANDGNYALALDRFHSLHPDFLALDLGVFHRGAHVVNFREAIAWSALGSRWRCSLPRAMFYWRGREEAVQFTTGYFIELSLSLDNVFVIALIFAAFACRRNTSIASCFGAFWACS